MEVEKRTALSNLRQRRFGESFCVGEDDSKNFIMSPAGQVASQTNLPSLHAHFDRPVPSPHTPSSVEDLLGDSLLGPQEIAVLLQAGLISVVKGSTVVQLNQRSK